jgi:hypothetical protein
MANQMAAHCCASWQHFQGHAHREEKNVDHLVGDRAMSAQIYPGIGIAGLHINTLHLASHRWNTNNSTKGNFVEQSIGTEASCTLSCLVC